MGNPRCEKEWLIMPDLDRIDKSMSNFGVLLGVAFGALIAYIILKKNQTPVQTIPFQIIPETSDTIHNQLSTQDIQYIYDQQSDIYNQIRLLNDLLNRQDESLQQYNQAILQQYQNIPYTISYTINTELQQIAIYLQNMSSQLEQTNLQLQQILKQQQTMTQQSKQPSQQPQEPQQPQQQHQDSLLRYVKQQLLDNSKVLSQDRPQQEYQQPKQLQTDSEKQSQKDNLQSSDTAYKNNEKWAIKRGSDGKIKSLEIIRKALSKKA
jgi:signal transduction histidine kinase